jgi:hypothetical protein
VARFAVVVMLPPPADDEQRVDFVSREFDTWPEFAEAMAEVEEKSPSWRVVSVVHVEDLPLLMEPGPDFGAVE